ncbi:D-inositol 3-phosphate glycosyltransferase [Clostridium ragsdalei P11]|uniref:D-inositol 3-phosphate glycosyltransferase n=1 Tax=Clostridium ragsdalei P11 TaxID=1353534 RepID=A0A1A6AIL4_9CLOT|nr:glycosyltransferase family 4 protein [Clostridium ragsdalei]OBR89891.1 D-inositol 3-phosphate glycosyltransferase [Clostridium ragsdalei P11]
MEEEAILDINSKKKVVIITDAPSPYRVDFFLYLQENYMDYEFTVIFTNGSTRKWNVNYKKLNKYYILKALKIKYPTKFDRRFLVISYGINRVLNSVKPDVIVASEYNMTVQTAFLWSRLHKKKFISWTDGTLRSEQEFKGLRIFIRKKIIKGANAYIASSINSKKLQMNYGAEESKIHISYLTVDIDSYMVKHKPRGKFQILFVGRLVKGKGTSLLLEALKRVNGDYKLLIAGDGPELENVKQKVNELDLSSKVEFLGFLQREELTKHYASSNLFVLPTLNDCFGLVILEAMCAGLPVISTIYAGGAPDLIDEGVSGMIVDPHNTKQFAEAIQKVMDDQDYAKKLGENALKKVHDFHFSRVAKGYMGAIDEALK